ncbi:hypothetical protein [Hungatella hathewayi]|uniref:hypothetical protein n=1 Tax=Hungatella hathewayi TaxID=154046 RepID=UPI00356533BE
MKNKTKSVLAAFRSKFAAALPIILFFPFFILLYDPIIRHFLFNPRIGGYNPVQGQLSEISNSPAADRSCGDAVFDGSSQLFCLPQRCTLHSSQSDRSLSAGFSPDLAV